MRRKTKVDEFSFKNVSFFVFRASRCFFMFFGFLCFFRKNSFCHPMIGDERIFLIFQKCDEITVQLQSIISQSILLVGWWNYIQSKAQKGSFRLDTILSPFEQNRPKYDRLKFNGIFQMFWNAKFIHRRYWLPDCTRRSRIIFVKNGITCGFDRVITRKHGVCVKKTLRIFSWKTTMYFNGMYSGISR